MVHRNTLIAFILLGMIAVVSAMGTRKLGGLTKIDAHSDPTLWYRARDVALMVKEGVISELNEHGYGLKDAPVTYDFELDSLKLQVLFS